MQHGASEGERRAAAAALQGGGGDFHLS